MDFGAARTNEPGSRVGRPTFYGVKKSLFLQYKKRCGENGKNLLTPSLAYRC